MKPPAFQFYPDDFLAGTFHMSQKDVGAYIRLLCVQWNNGAIPSESEKISRLAGGKVSEEVIGKFQKCDDGLLRNQRLEKERGKQEQFRAMQRDKGVKSAQARAAAVEQRLNRGSNPVGTEGQPEVEVRLEPKGNSPSPSPSPSVSPSPIKTPCSPPSDNPKDSEPSKKDILKENAERVIQVLNECTGSQFRCSDGNLKLITARLEEDGVDLAGVLKMVRRQSMVWGSDEKMAAYLRPETLFNKTKFESYYANRDMPIQPPLGGTSKSDAWKVKNIYDVV